MNPTRTTTAMLEGLADAGNAAVWGEFDKRYRPILIGFARRLGLNETDAADVAQETMTRFVEEYRAGKYDRDRGRLRSWLVGLAKYRALGVLRNKAARGGQRGSSAIVETPDDDELSTIWDEERRQAVLREAMVRLRTDTRTNERTIRAFELLVFNQQSASAVAEQLEMSTHDVYLAKNRVADRLRDIVQAVDDAYEDGEA